MSLFFCLRDLIVRCHVLAYSTCTVCSPKSYRWDSRDPECSVATIPVKWSQMGWHATLQWCYCCHSNSADGSPIISVFPWTISRQLNNDIFCQKQLITAVFFLVLHQSSYLKHSLDKQMVTKCRYVSFLCCEVNLQLRSHSAIQLNCFTVAE